MKYKRTVIAVTTLATLTTASTVLAATHDNPPLPTETVATTHKEEPTQPVTEETAPVEEPTSTVVATPDGKPVVQQTAPVTQPDYGEDPSNPGTFIVFNKQAVMDAAGIPKEEQATANTVLSSYGGWRYKAPDAKVNLCYIIPGSKMAIMGEDYDTNPVTQLKWCHQFLTSRNGSWQGTLDLLTSTGRLY